MAQYAAKGVSSISNIGCVVIPTYDEFLEALVKRREKFTTLIWPGHRTKANRMVGPHSWLIAGPRKPAQAGRQPPQKAIPFLYRGIGGEVEPPYEVTHVSLAVYMVHDDVYTQEPVIQEVLRALRVEEHCSIRGWGDEGVRTWYVVTETSRLDNPIPYNQLRLIRQDRPLAPNFTRGYGLVWLPESLRNWYSDGLAKYADLLALSNIERWHVLPEQERAG